MWIDVDESTIFPAYFEEVKSRDTKKGEVKQTIPMQNLFLAQSKCGKTIMTYENAKGRLVGFATDERPTRYMEIPEVTVLP